MEFSDNFTRAFNDLKNNKALVVPVFLVALVGSAITLLIVSELGFLDFMLSQGQESEMIQNVSFDFSQVSWSFIALLIVAGVLVYLFLICTFYSMVSNQLSGRPVSLGKGFKEAPGLMGKFLIYRIAWLLIIGVPIAVAAGLAFFFFNMGFWAGMLSVPIFLLALLVYWIFISTRLVFSLPELFLAGKGPLEAFEMSYGHTRGHFKQAFLLLAILIGIGLARGFITGDPFSNVANVVDVGTVMIVVSSLVGLVILLLSSAVLAFGELYLFHSYKDFVRSKE